MAQGTLRDFTFGTTMNLSAEWITGFVDGEGCFHVGVARHPDMSTGFQVLPEFTIVQHERDVQLLHAIKAYFGVGVVRKNHGDRMAYRVRDRRHLTERIVPFFEEHPLRSRKRIDFEKFRSVLLMMSKGDHLSADGVEGIRQIASQMNRGPSR